MNVKTILAGLIKRWPIAVVAASVTLTVVWIGALIWVLVVLAGFSGT
jgi:hypothetical protein